MTQSYGRHAAYRPLSDAQLLARAIKDCEADPTLPRPSPPGIIDNVRVALRRQGMTYSGLVTTTRNAWQPAARRPYFTEVDIVHDVLTLPFEHHRPTREDLLGELALLLDLLLKPREGLPTAILLSASMDMDPLPGL